MCGARAEWITSGPVVGRKLESDSLDIKGIVNYLFKIIVYARINDPQTVL